MLNESLKEKINQSKRISEPSKTKEEYVYDVLRSAIMHNELKPGEKLIIDHLAAELNISSIPFRGALQRLQSEGLVEITPHTGALVSEISPDMVDEIFTLLELLETMAFSIASKKADETEIAHLEELQNEMEKALAANDKECWYELNSSFHRSVAEISKMKLLIEFTSRTLDIWDRLRRCCFEEVSPKLILVSKDDHKAMIEHMRNHDLSELLEVVRLHNRNAQEEYRKLLTS
jgi:DNA-binding GntR family transcriptional regulator